MNRRILFIVFILLILASCAPVLEQEYLSRGSTDLSFPALLNDPDRFKGRLFLLGGRIIDTQTTDEGSVIEAEYIPVDAEGRLQDTERVSGRFMAFLPREKGTLQPERYSKGERITIAGEFVEMEPRTRGEVEYIHPLFEIKDIHLWKKGPISYAPLPPSETYQDPTLLSDPFRRDRPRP